MDQQIKKMKAIDFFSLDLTFILTKSVDACAHTYFDKKNKKCRGFVNFLYCEFN